jgi:capsular polysaccharide biosynthesis protein
MAHRWWVILVILGTFLLAAGALSLRPRTYAAVAQIYLDTARTAPGFDLGVQTGELLQHDLVVLSTSRPVLQAACASPSVHCTPAELASPETTLAQRVSAGVYKGTSTLTVTAKAPMPNEAADLANAVAEAMIDQDRSEVARLFKPIRDDLQRQLTQLAAAMDKEQQQLQQSATGSSVAAGHQAALGRLQTQYSATFTRLLDLTEEQNRAANVATISQSALPPLRPDTPNPKRYLLAALLAGLCVGVFAALLLERWDDRIFDAEGLAAAISSPVALVARGVRRRPPPADRSYGLALASVLAGSADAHAFLVTAASSRDHSGPVAASLGAVAAEAGKHAVVIQSDGLSVPRPEVVGLTTITPADHGLDLATALTDMGKQHNAVDGVVLMAVPSPDTSPLALVAGRTTKHAVLTATAGVTRFGDARRTAERLRQSGVEVVVGILLARRTPAL